ncbi:MAG: hypothetical protein K1Y36_24645 [Blastocatellia bacterium]|nr:hypothetical protein [Blastocatellia bacterium]
MLDETGRLLDSNTEPKDGRNARLTIQMPSSGRVRVMVGSYEPQTTGRYRLAVVETGSR